MARRLPPGPAGNAARFVLSGSLERCVAQLERLITPLGVAAWTPAGMPPDLSPAIHHQLAEARRLARAQRHRAAMRAYEAAEVMTRESAPTIRELRRRRQSAPLDARDLQAIESALNTGEEKAAALQLKADTLQTKLTVAGPLVRIGRKMKAGARKARRHAHEDSGDRWVPLGPIIAALEKTKPPDIIRVWSVAGYIQAQLIALQHQQQQAPTCHLMVGDVSVPPLDWVPSQKSLDRRLKAMPARSR